MPRTKPKFDVIITVRKGMAEIVQTSPGVSVVIVDFDCPDPDDPNRPGTVMDSVMIPDCTGIPTGYMGILCGSGYSGKTLELDSLVQEAAKALSALFRAPVEIRFNSNQRSGVRRNPQDHEDMENVKAPEL